MFRLNQRPSRSQRERLKSDTSRTNRVPVCQRQCFAPTEPLCQLFMSPDCLCVSEKDDLQSAPRFNGETGLNGISSPVNGACCLCSENERTVDCQPVNQRLMFVVIPPVTTVLRGSLSGCHGDRLTFCSERLRGSSDLPCSFHTVRPQVMEDYYLGY